MVCWDGDSCRDREGSTTGLRKLKGQEHTHREHASSCPQHESQRAAAQDSEGARAPVAGLGAPAHGPGTPPFQPLCSCLLPLSWFEGKAEAAPLGRSLSLSYLHKFRGWSHGVQHWVYLKGHPCAHTQRGLAKHHTAPRLYVFLRVSAGSRCAWRIQFRVPKSSDREPTMPTWGSGDGDQSTSVLCWL